MVSLSTYLGRDSLIRIESGHHDEVLNALIHHCLRDHPEAEREQIRGRLEGGNRMKDQNMGGGFAITHARLDTVRDIRMAVGLLGRQARFCKGAPVHTVICAIIPVDKANEYLGLMARLCRLLTQPDVDKIFAAGDADRIFERIKAFDA
jgi:mannitol/fructose-specific phosphotransferase system IIA component (Ntr-type)